MEMMTSRFRVMVSREMKQRTKNWGRASDKRSLGFLQEPLRSWGKHRKAIKLTLTLQILQPGSCEANIL
ncbi:unnamed protein product [Menidia menidia]|uniref:(Atlantic silverside) hypothetical protein n=1 Tax=Menidia menidia TaxID=238744 RepID=A0A8S4ABK5_9TELE|nr:unnamed protein product [Menidia menidia]